MGKSWRTKIALKNTHQNKFIIHAQQQFNFKQQFFQPDALTVISVAVNKNICQCGHAPQVSPELQHPNAIASSPLRYECTHLPGLARKSVGKGDMKFVATGEVGLSQHSLFRLSHGHLPVSRLSGHRTKFEAKGASFQRVSATWQNVWVRTEEGNATLNIFVNSALSTSVSVVAPRQNLDGRKRMILLHAPMLQQLRREPAKRINTRS